MRQKNTSMPWKLWGQHLSLPGHAQDCGGHHCNSHFGLCCRIGEHFGAYIASVPTGLFSTADYIKGIRSFLCPTMCLWCLSKAVVLPTSSPAFPATRATLSKGQHRTRWNQHTRCGVQRYFNPPGRLHHCRSANRLINQTWSGAKHKKKHSENRKCSRASPSPLKKGKPTWSLVSRGRKNRLAQNSGRTHEAHGR